MGADQKQDRTPHKREGRGGVWLEEGRFAEPGSFEWYLWLRHEEICSRHMSALIYLVQKANHEERALLALDFPAVVAALEAPDWYKAPVGREQEVALKAPAVLIVSEDGGPVLVLANLEPGSYGVRVRPKPDENEVAEHE